jgi:hypothetical protein
MRGPRIMEVSITTKVGNNGRGMMYGDPWGGRECATPDRGE